MADKDDGKMFFFGDNNKRGMILGDLWQWHGPPRLRKAWRTVNSSDTRRCHWILT